ncbi:mono-functional DNA-alkylating methyl methanesulfonate N-term-domain-containing protein [Truncatella angustata]|uniref:Mono-functional DNA-alkylating methyl methanesulfonate N-term-domain-containing protein n=1 Tax=Truncatella angustata TaxID=152316 RepID=A0A9P8UVD0_9PEZI|nr:mono-functional DNA-alkylating methyl methanesulfonate N-term-domain-containing protein [Truncatella angustata]KAH6659037.1 mono-functional DNA-alkylating methyl methanesulfonate N-term-domain-containing protein [Truncatella angustata]KAH8200677.1 hypothetical protein TruAng_005141 [Truncatella angustata]
MALQTSVFENGEWVTRTLEPRELFRQTIAPQQPKLRRPSSMPPTYGVLTRTVIDSPVFRWVLPVQLRSSRHNDVAFIGDNFVQICELGRDVQLQDVARKQDFGSRIRNACVIGRPTNHYAGGTEEPHIKSEGDTPMQNAHPPRARLPPQFLALVLERGDLVFLYLDEGRTGGQRFVAHSEKIPDSRLVTAGFHLAVDPSSRFLTLGCTETHFQVWSLESMEILGSRHAQGLPLRPIKRLPYPRAVRGVIHKLEFLSPGVDSEERIILALILIYRGSSRLHRYEWELEDDVGAALRETNVGWLLDPSYQMPLLVIPSTVRESFLMVTETSQAFWATLKHGILEASEVDIGEHDRTELHIGGRAPLWTAWSRPWRVPEYHLDNDTIWLAREDGILNFLEITAADGLLTNVIMEEVECNIDTAFACLYDPFADILITGGNSGPGAIWRAEPREAPRNIGTIRNWSPTVDITSTNVGLDARPSRTRTRGNPESGIFLKSDRIFACSGRGQTGTIVELRYGFEAKVGPEMDCGDPIKQCWVLDSPDSESDAEFYLLVAFPDRSDVFHVNVDTSKAEPQIQEEVPYDLSSTTLAALEIDGGTVVQVTTGSVTVISPEDSARHLPHELLDGELGAVITTSAIDGDIVALSFYSDSGFCVNTVRVDGLDLNQGARYKVGGEVTCVALAKLSEETVLLAGVWEAGQPLILICPIHARRQQVDPIRLEIATIPNLPLIEPLTSIICFEGGSGNPSLCAGTRSGEIITLDLGPEDPMDFQGAWDKFGSSAAQVFPMSTGLEAASLFVCCDSQLFMLTNSSKRKKSGFEKRHRVWVTGAISENGPSPNVNAVSRMRRNLSQVAGRSTLAVVSGSSVYIAELQATPKPVPRDLELHATPSKIMYYHRLKALVVAVLEDDRPALRFIDPETGQDLSLPTNISGDEVQHISGLGEPGSKILALTQWIYQKDGNTWGYIVVSVRTPDGTGRILIIMATKDDRRVSEDGPRRIRFYTKMIRPAYAKPVYSITTDTHGLILCSGDTILYEILDIESKKLRQVKEHQLSSPAAWMEVVGGKLHVVTTKHSLEIVDFSGSPESDLMTRVYSDDRAKCTSHCIEAVDTSRTGNLERITLLSDIYCGLWGMWAPPPGGDAPLKPIFHAELQASVRRFIRAKCRPQWSALNRESKGFGLIQSSADGSDILGVGIDGSLRHFTILNVDAWRLLRFIQNLALTRPDICLPPATNAVAEEDSQDDLMEVECNPEPRTLPVLNMQVDGDILQRCYDKGVLEELVSQSAYATRLRQLLEAVDGGKHTQAMGGPAQMSEYIELAYDILEHYLAPVL